MTRLNILLVLLLNSGLIGFASSMFEEGKTWICISADPCEGDPVYYEYYIDGNIEVDGIQAKELRKREVEQRSDEHSDTGIAVYENNGEVYLYSQQEERFFQIMNMNLEVGQYAETGQIVMNSFTQTICGINRKILSLGWEGCSPSCYWIEGIGTTSQSVFGYEAPIGAYTQMIECSLDGKTIYQNGMINDPSLAESPFRAVVSGRTWWYSGALANKNPWEYRSVTYGLQLISPVDGSDGWLDCVLVDVKKDRMIDKAVCQVREEDGKVWVKPALNLRSAYSDETFQNSWYWSQEGNNALSSFANFLAYWGGEYLMNPDEWTDESEQYKVRWTDKGPGAEYLLYDFNLQPGDKCEWSWTAEDKWEPEEWPYAKSIIIDTVAEQEETGRKIFRTSQKYGGDNEEVCHLEIIEGIGVVSGTYRPFIPYFYGYHGFWIAPCSPGNSSITTSIGQMTEPKLMSVTEADGTCIYGDPDFEPSLAQIASPEASRPAGRQLYDLQGRPLSEPVRGQLYVRDGKLQFAK